MQFGEIGTQRRVVELAPVEPGVEPAKGAGGPSGQETGFALNSQLLV